MQCPETPQALADYVYRQINPVLESKRLNKIVVGYSGGLDSTVLLHILAGLKAQFEPILILAAHVNHGVNPSAGLWTEQCRLFCQTLNLQFKVTNLSLGKVQSNREAVYRKARYDAFINELSDTGLLLTAHHRQDQAETILINLFRGGGVSGLRGMKRVRQLTHGYHLRPLLSISPAKLAEYAQYHQLHWIEDPSNQDQDFDRNYIRHQLFPLISKRWSAVQNSIVRSADLLNHADIILNEVAKDDLAAIETKEYPHVIEGLYISVLSIKALTTLSELRQFNALKYWLEINCSLNLSYGQTRQIHQDLCQKPLARGLFEFKKIQIRVFNGYLYLMEELPSVEAVDHTIAKNNNNILFEQLGLKLKLDMDAEQNLEFRLRAGGEKLRLDGQTKTLKCIYQQKAVPPWERQLIPLIFSKNRLVAVPGVVIADNCAINNARIIKLVTEDA